MERESDLDAGSCSDCDDSIAEVGGAGDEIGEDDHDAQEDVDEVDIAVSDYGEDDSDVDETCSYQPSSKTISTRVETSYPDVLFESDGEYPDILVV